MSFKLIQKFKEDICSLVSSTLRIFKISNYKEFIFENYLLLVILSCGIFFAGILLLFGGLLTGFGVTKVSINSFVTSGKIAMVAYIISLFDRTQGDD